MAARTDVSDAEHRLDLFDGRLCILLRSNNEHVVYVFDNVNGSSTSAAY